MDKEDVMQRLNTQLSQLNRQFEIIRQPGAKIPKLEMDRMLSDIRATYELFTVLNYLNTYQRTELPSEPAALPKEEISPVVREEVKAIFHPEQPEAPKPEPKPQQQQQAPQKVQQVISAKEKPATVFEKSVDPTENIADKFRQKKIDDLRKAVPLHEKFLFINELFGGDNAPYNQLIENVNASGSWNEAAALLGQAKEKYRWDESSKVYLKFSDLIRRKF